MVKLLSIDSLMNTIDTLSNIYDAIRIIHPVTKKIYDFKSSSYELVLEDFPCYTYWNRNKICKNCVSMKAYNTENTSIKIEGKGEDTYIVMAVPIYVNNEKLILEFIKNSSNSLTLQDVENNLNLELNNQLSNTPNSMSVDLVTGANNRYYLETKLPADIYKSAVNNSTISIIMADLDNFKDINDTYGHLAGDEALKTFTNLAKMCIREDDWIARFGGDEFIIVLNNTDALNAYKVADRIRNALEKKVIFYKDKVINITASFGVYEIELDEVLDDYRKAIEKADIELLKAKKNGKNMISTE
ncbi:GGDEF domain-containing protein [Soehngenia longivitae]|uniref:GGDEF domain-containing protein n=1 Tax=Soehngenia longivitae TaxID=2562294 RepID=A0A4Z0DA71_9FIRM|nr:GGDEF domain-containing protein [Soehngenia longivitae]TFZ41770.1 GGDEF domain-containing protein [Soehngenia longivitae]